MVQVVHSTVEDTAALKRLWKEIFGDTDLYIDLFFQYKYVPENTFLIKKNGCVVSMLYFFPTTFRFRSNSVPVAYICGVATKKEERGQGYSQKILSAATQAIQQRGYYAAFLIPASEALFDFYRKAAGFQPYFFLTQYERSLQKKSITQPKIYPFSAESFAELYLRFHQKKLFFCEKTAADFQELFTFYQPEGCQFHLLEDGYLICYPEEKVLIVREAFCADTETLENAIQFLMAENHCTKARITCPSGSRNGTPYASLLPLKEKEILAIENNYVNLMFN